MTFTGAFIAGILSFLSPCVLPLVPAYLSYISGVSIDTLRESGGSHRYRAIIQSLWFVSGFSLVFIFLGASATLLGQLLWQNMNLLAQIAGGIIFIFGLHYTGLIRIRFLMMDAHVDTNKLKTSHGFGALLLGAAFAFGWTPCVGPILGAILAIASTQNDLSLGILLLCSYSAGLAIPFLLAATLTDQFMRWMIRFRQHLRTLEIFSGILLMIVGVLIFMGDFNLLASWVSEVFPALADIESSLKN
ncbi:MAG: cytochrome c biogenesis protein CcdA [Mariprofundaceae bacterium]|nr:cytochrome c biogenesis protein CcdA [Mariprofundaceae bacterium]